MIRIKQNLKDYGAEKKLWYHPHQGETYPVVMETKKGFLVKRPLEELDGGEDTYYLVKEKHTTVLTEEEVEQESYDVQPVDDDIV